MAQFKNGAGWPQPLVVPGKMFQTPGRAPGLSKERAVESRLSQPVSNFRPRDYRNQRSTLRADAPKGRRRRGKDVICPGVGEVADPDNAFAELPPRCMSSRISVTRTSDRFSGNLPRTLRSISATCTQASSYGTAPSPRRIDRIIIPCAGSAGTSGSPRRLTTEVTYAPLGAVNGR